jgi:hypothetical protein
MIVSAVPAVIRPSGQENPVALSTLEDWFCVESLVMFNSRGDHGAMGLSIA